MLSGEPDATWSNKTLFVILQLLQLEMEVVVTVDKELLRKAVTGRFPYLEKQAGFVICEHLPIARILSKGHPVINGCSEQDAASVDMWIDYINATVAPCATKVVA